MSRHHQTHDSHFSPRPAGHGLTYGLLKGKVSTFGTEDGEKSPHFQLIVDDGTQIWRCAVNVRSDDGSNDLAIIVDPLENDFLAQLPDVAAGFNPLPDHVAGLALDFVRQPMFSIDDMQSLPPFPEEGSDDKNDIEDLLAALTQRAIDDAGAEVYVWGAKFVVDPNKPRPADIKFGNKVGVHDIHMNQLNPPPHDKDNGVFQDGGVIFHFSGDDAKFVGVFMKFESQK